MKNLWIENHLLESLENKIWNERDERERERRIPKERITIRKRLIKRLLGFNLQHEIIHLVSLLFLFLESCKLEYENNWFLVNRFLNFIFWIADLWRELLINSYYLLFKPFVSMKSIIICVCLLETNSWIDFIFIINRL